MELFACWLLCCLLFNRTYWYWLLGCKWLSLSFIPSRALVSRTHQNNLKRDTSLKFPCNCRLSQELRKFLLRSDPIQSEIPSTPYVHIIAPWSAGYVSPNIFPETCLSPRQYRWGWKSRRSIWRRTLPSTPTSLLTRLRVSSTCTGKFVECQHCNWNCVEMWHDCGF